MSKLLPYRKSTLTHPNADGGWVGARSARPVSGGVFGTGSHKSGKEQVEEALDMLYRRKWVVLVCFLAAVAIAVWYTYPVTPVYQANSYIMADLGYAYGRAQPATNQVVAPGADNLFGHNSRTVTDELMLLRISSPLASRVADRFLEMGVRPDGEPFTFVRGEDGATYSANQLGQVLAGQVVFQPERGSYNIIRVTATGAHPIEAALLANIFAEEYEKLTQEAGASRVDATIQYLENLEEERRADLERIEGDIRAYLAQAGATNLDALASQLVTQIGQVEAQREDARIDRQLRSDELARVESEIEELSGRVPERIIVDNSQQIEALKQEIATLDAHKQAILTRYRPEWDQRPPSVDAEIERVDTRLAELKADLDEAVQGYAGEAVTDAGATAATALGRIGTLRQQRDAERKAILSLDTRIRLLDERLEKLTGDFDRAPVQSRAFAQLERARVSAEQMYQYVSQRLIDLRIAGQPEQSAGYVRLLQRATSASLLPSEASRNLILGAFLGLLVGLGLAALWDRLDNRIYKPDQLRDYGQLAIGVIPNMRTYIRKDHGGKGFLVQNGRRVATSLATVVNPTSPIAEAYRPLRMNIEFSHPGRSWKTILVTSASTGEGKSVTAANLAVVMARAGRRTLLVDADLRRPQVHALLGLDNEFGLLQVLSGAPLPSDSEMATDIENLYALPAGGASDDSAELLSSVRLGQILVDLQETFDVVIIDSPPTLALTDAALVAAHCDASVVVARAGKTKEKELEYCLDMLERSGTTVVGVTLNGFDIAMAYGYAYRYHRYSPYGMYGGYAKSA